MVTMISLKVYFGLSLPLGVSLYLFLENILMGSGLISLPISAGLLVLFTVISLVVLMHISEKEEIEIISDQFS
ncbi:MAG: hypothetical protein ACLFS3_03410 [Candidatus Aenigmatarchaeota archaeon]